jgi:acetyl-CoA synthetase
VDTWWQTETGGILISPLPGATDLKPGSATKPLFGIRPEIVDAEGKTIHGAGSGNLVLLDSWPGQMRTVYGDHDGFVQTYFSTYIGRYFTGDGCRRDADGYYWITGRVDDVINVAGHRLSTGSMEAVVATHPMVAECAVIGVHDQLKGQLPRAFVVLKSGADIDPEQLQREIVKSVRDEIGPVAAFKSVVIVPALPKTRSGKILRRTMRGIADGRPEAPPSTIEDLSVLDVLRPLLQDSGS